MAMSSRAVLSSLTKSLSSLSLQQSRTRLLSKNNFVSQWPTVLTAASSSILSPSTATTIRQFSSEDDKDAEWNAFQKTLMFDNLDSSLPTNVKKRGGKAARKRREREAELLKKDERNLIDAGTGQFPPLRFSDEETERLLKEAYAALPPKGISKKTRARKRQKNRFTIIRRARYIKKQEKIAHHFATMEKRSSNLKAVKAVKEGAPEVRAHDLQHQRDVLERWIMMNGLLDENQSNDNLPVGDGSTVEGEKKQEIMN